MATDDWQRIEFYDQEKMMPIITPEMDITHDRSEFDCLDYKVVGKCFDIHNDKGSLCPEKVYQNILFEQCSEFFDFVEKEVPVDVNFESFHKRCYIDLLINRRALFELKVTDSICENHYAQTLNYLFLTGLQFGKIINFGGFSVEKSFVAVKDSIKDPSIFSFVVQNQFKVSSGGKALLELLRAILDDLGAYLEVHLYESIISALICNVINVPIYYDEKIVGAKKMLMLNDFEVVHITGLHKNLESNEKHISQLLSSTKLERLYWINLLGGECSVKVLENV